MSQLYQFVAELLSDGKLCSADVDRVREMLALDGQIDLADVKLLVELYCGTQKRSEAFDDLFFTVLEHVLLADGQVGPGEQFYLLKMLYSDREIHPRERDFLRVLQSKAARRSPEFDALCATAFASPDRNWSVE